MQGGIKNEDNYIVHNFLIIKCILISRGEVAEWSKANDSKSFNRQLFVGSNPTLSGLFLVSGSVSSLLIVSQSMQKPVLVGVFSIFFLK